MQIGVDSARAVDNKRVFVVVADEIIRAALQFMLHDEHEAHELADVNAALQQSTRGAPDVMLIGEDAATPSCAQAVKAQLPKVKLVLVVADKNSAAAQAALGNGYDAVLSKPLTIESARRVVDRMLGRKLSIALHAI